MGLTPFWLATVAAIACAGIYVFGTEASVPSKIGILMVVGASLVLQHAFPSLVNWAIGLSLQAAVGVFVIVYLKVAG